MHTLSTEMIYDASEYLKDQVRQTPCEYSIELSEKMGVPVYLKCEFMQLTGSFKVRGAAYRLSKLTEEEKKRGVVTCSAGNHGKAVAYIAKMMGIKATIYVPQSVDQAKLAGIRMYGAEVIVTACPGYDETELLAKEEAQKTNRVFITPYDEDQIMASNGGSLAVEILEQVPNALTILFPVGGGGLGAGLSYYVKEKNPKITLIGCQHRDSPALKESLEKGVAVTQLPPIDTLAGGIEGGIGKNCFFYLQSRIDGVSLVTEEELRTALIWMLDHHQYLVEPSACAPLAACLSGRLGKLQGPVVIVLTGRNVSLKSVKEILIK